MKNVLNKTYSFAAILTLSFIVPDASANSRAAQQQQAAQAARQQLFAQAQANAAAAQQANGVFGMATIIQNNKNINTMAQNGLTAAERDRIANIRLENRHIISSNTATNPNPAVNPVVAAAVGAVAANQGVANPISKPVVSKPNPTKVHNDSFKNQRAVNDRLLNDLKLSKSLKESLTLYKEKILGRICPAVYPSECNDRTLSLLRNLNKSLQDMLSLSKGSDVQWTHAGSDADNFVDTYDVSRGKVAPNQPRAMSPQSFLDSGHQYIGPMDTGGTGALVAEDLVLTCAHCIKQSALKNPSIATFQPGRHPGTVSIGQTKFKARAIHTFGNYHAEVDPSKDIALVSLVIPAKNAGQKFQRGVAVASEKEAVSSLKSDRAKFILGYPSSLYGGIRDEQEGFPVNHPHVTGPSKVAFTQFGDVEYKGLVTSPVGLLKGFERVQRNEKTLWSKDLGVYGGNSGGPILVGGKIVGVISLGQHIESSRGKVTSTATGVRYLTDDVIAQINSRLQSVK